MRRADDRLRPACESLEGRRVPSGARFHVTDQPEVAWLADQPAFQADARGMHDFNRYDADGLALAGTTYRHLDHSAETSLARDLLSMIRTPGPDVDTAGLIRLMGVRDFSTFAPGTEPTFEARYGPALEALGIPEPLIHKFFAHRRAFNRSVSTPSKTASSKAVDDLQALIDDGIRVGVIHYGDPHYQQLAVDVKDLGSSVSLYLPINLYNRTK